MAATFFYHCRVDSGFWDLESFGFFGFFFFYKRIATKNPPASPKQIVHCGPVRHAENPVESDTDFPNTRL